jgi:hypothetical protein
MFGKESWSYFVKDCLKCFCKLSGIVGRKLSIDWRELWHRIGREFETRSLHVIYRYHECKLIG